MPFLSDHVTKPCYINQQTSVLANKRNNRNKKLLVKKIIIMDTSKLPPERHRTGMKAEEKVVYLRVAAAADPASVTRAEKNQIFGQPPPDEEDRLCQEKIGITMEELKRKVMSDPETLTEDECDIILFGATYEWNRPRIGRPPLRMAFLPDEEYRLASQVHELLANDYDDEISRRAELRAKAFEIVKKRAS